jgi:hypothetical protein
MSKIAKPRTQTIQGLGAVKVPSVERRAASSDSPGSFRSEPVTRLGNAKRSDRPAVSVDTVGDAAVAIAGRTPTKRAPALIASQADIAKAPLDATSAYVLSLIDGRNTLEAIVDVTGMDRPTVDALLDRLARLGLITLR